MNPYVSHGAAAASGSLVTVAVVWFRSWRKESKDKKAAEAAAKTPAPAATPAPVATETPEDKKKKKTA